MAPKKKVTGLIKLQIKAGAANPAPPIGPALALLEARSVDSTPALSLAPVPRASLSCACVVGGPPRVVCWLGASPRSRVTHLAAHQCPVGVGCVLCCGSCVVLCCFAVVDWSYARCPSWGVFVCEAQVRLRSTR